MKKNLLFLLLLCFSLHRVSAQCAEQNQTKILMMGDSWAYFMHFEQTLNQVMAKWGHSNVKYVSNGTLSENGTQTDDFLKDDKKNAFLAALAQNPDIEIVHLSIGGNDMLGDWKKSFTQGHTDTLRHEVLFRLDSIVQFIKAAKPGIKILWSGYTYPNFEEPITSPGLFTGSNHPFYGTWSDMEFPNFLQINTVLNDVSTDMIAYTSTEPDVYFVNATGILQYTTGQSSPLCCGIQPQATYPAHSVSLPLGDPNYPSPISTMRDYLGLTKDCFHLSPGGYLDFVGYHAQKFYQKALMDDKYLLSADNAQTGSVSSTGNTADSLVLGEASGEQFATVLSFNTTTMADTTLAKASLFLRRKSSTGNNPVNGSLEVKVKSGNFGATINIEAADFNAASDASGTPCQFGTNSNGNWIRLDLPASLYPFITNIAETQFIISSPGFTGGTVVFNNSSDPDFAPVLNLKYGVVSRVEEIESSTFSIYPNPAGNTISVNTNGEPIRNIELTDVLGKVLIKPVVNSNSIDISNLSTGVYIMNITTAKVTSSQKFIKE